MAIKMDDIELYNTLHPRRFENSEDVKHYLGGDSITCLVCNKNFKVLSGHLSRGHGCSAKKYKDFLNIPRRLPLMVKSELEKRAVFAKKMLDENPDLKAFLMTGHHNPNGHNGGVTSSISIENQRRARQMNGKKNKGKAHTREIGQCYSCKKQIEISSIRRNRVVKCENCKAETIKVANLRWSQNNPDKNSSFYYKQKKQMETLNDKDL